MMANETLYDQKELQDALEETFVFVSTILDQFDAAGINKSPFAGSWTAAQVADHLAKSNQSIAKALVLTGTPINRDPGDRIAELKEIFLNFDTKLKAPAFILPSGGQYEKADVLLTFTKSYSRLLALCEEAELSTMINHPAFGDITRFEILHFVLFHTLRHTNQLENIFMAVYNRPV